MSNNIKLFSSIKYISVVFIIILNMLYYFLITDDLNGGYLVKRVYFISLFVMIFIVSGAVYSSPAPDFDKVADFSITLKALNSMAAENKLSELKDRYFILDGALSSFTVIDKDPENYTVELLLVNGEWEGVSDVHIFRSVVVVKGKEYVKKFPARRSKNGTGQEIPLNSGLIIVAKLNNIINMGNVSVPVLDGYYIRVFK